MSRRSAPAEAVLIATLTACTPQAGGSGGGDRASGCAGTLITVPENGSGFTVPQLMAHASAMGMNQQEAETLIYLEGIAPQATLQPGERICLDGKPDR